MPNKIVTEIIIENTCMYLIKFMFVCKQSARKLLKNKYFDCLEIAPKHQKLNQHLFNKQAKFDKAF